MKKRVLSMLLALVLLASLLPAMSGTANAGSTRNIEITGALQIAPGTVLPEFPAGSYFTKDGGPCTGHANESTCVNAINLMRTGQETISLNLKSSQCYAFAFYCMYRYTGVTPSDQFNLANYQTPCDGIVETHTDDMKRFSEAEIKDILMNTPVGSHLRIYRGSYNHSMILLSASDSGVTIYDCNRFNDYHCKVSIEEKSYQWMTNYINGSGGGRHGFSFIQSPATTTPPHVHDMHLFAARPATCIQAGMNRDFYQCFDCQKIYLDLAATQEIPFADAYNLPIDPNNHDGGTEIRGAVSATVTTNGYTGDTYCKGCGKMISAGKAIPSTGGTAGGNAGGSVESKDGGTTVVIPPVNKESAEMRFADVPDTAWFAPAVAYMVEIGLMSGVTETTFAPNDTLTRAMLAQILYNKENHPAVQVGGFTDVAKDAWYSSAVSWCAGNGIVSGYGDGRFGPNDSITREQLVVMLWRYAGQPDSNASLNQFSDMGQISAYARTAMAWAVEQCIVSGSNGALLPRTYASRAQTAQILMNYFENNR